MERVDGRRIFLWLAVPSVLFVAVEAVSAVGMFPGPIRRIAGLYGAQPGATVVLGSALAALAVALDRVEVSAGDGGLTLKIQAVALACVIGRGRFRMALDHRVRMALLSEVLRACHWGMGSRR